MIAQNKGLSEFDKLRARAVKAYDIKPREFLDQVNETWESLGAELKTAILALANIKTTENNFFRYQRFTTMPKEDQERFENFVGEFKEKLSSIAWKIEYARLAELVELDAEQ